MQAGWRKGETDGWKRKIRETERRGLKKVKHEPCCLSVASEIKNLHVSSYVIKHSAPGTVSNSFVFKSVLNSLDATETRPKLEMK